MLKVYALDGNMRSPYATGRMDLLGVLDEPSFSHRRSPVTLRNYRIALRWWCRSGVTRAADVNVRSAQAHLDSRLTTCRPQSVALELHALLAVLTHLARTERFDAALARSLRELRPRVPRPRQLRARYLTPDEWRMVEAAASGPTLLALRLAVLAGLRAGEIVRLEWSDLDLAGRVLHVRSGKTGPRDVPIVAPLAAALAAAALDGQGAGRVVGLALPCLQEHVRGVARRSGVRFSLVTCRHTRASWWIQATPPVPIAKIAKWCGHSVETCLRYYAGLAPGYDADAERGATG